MERDVKGFSHAMVGAGKSEMQRAAGWILWQAFCVCILEEDSLFRTAQFLKAFNRLDNAHHIMEGNLFNSKSTDFNIYLLEVPILNINHI